MSKPLLMKDEFEVRDLQYNKVKDSYKNEIRGKSLKEMEFIKGLMIAQDHWKENKKNSADSAAKIFKPKKESSNFQLDTMNYLLGDQKSKIDLKDRIQMSDETQHLAAKLDARISTLRKTTHLSTLTLDKDRSSSFQRLGDRKRTTGHGKMQTNILGKISLKSIKVISKEENYIRDIESPSAMLSEKLRL